MYDEQVQKKYELKKEGLKLEKKSLDLAVDFYKKLILNSLFLNDYYQFKRLSVLYHKEKDYESERDIIRYFLKSGIYCNKIQFLSFKYKLRKLAKHGYITYEEIQDLTLKFKENSLKNKEASEIPVVTAQRIKKVGGNIKVVSDEYVFYNYKKPFLRTVVNKLYDEMMYQEAYDLYNLMIYYFNHTDHKFYMKLCGIYRRTENYKHELLVIKEYFEDPKVKRNKSSEKWFVKRLESSKELIDDDSTFNSIMNSDYVKAEHLFSNYPLKDLKVNLDNNFTLKEFDDYFNFRLESGDDIFKVVDYKKTKSKKKSNKNIKSKNKSKYGYKSDYKRVSVVKRLGVKKEFSFVTTIFEDELGSFDEPPKFYEYDSNLSNSQNMNRKLYLMDYGANLFKEKRYDDCINFNESLMENSYFENDWYPYKQLCNVYKKTEDYEAILKTVNQLLMSGIYLNDFQYLWFTDRIRIIREHIEIEESKVQECLDYYDENGAKNKDRLNNPIALADRIKKGNKIWVLSEEAFDVYQKIYEIEYICKILEKQGEYESALNYYKNQINGDFPIVKFYKRICYMLEKMDDYESELEHIRFYYKNPPKDASQMSNQWFEKRLAKVNKKLGTNYMFD